jgi:hypothetical protein
MLGAPPSGCGSLAWAQEPTDASLESTGDGEGAGPVVPADEPPAKPVVTPTMAADVEGEPAPPEAPPVPPGEEQPEDFGRELRTVEEDVSNLKERVFRSKATLKLLKELVVDSAISGSRLAIWHVNKLGGGYSMESAQYFLDGKGVFAKVDPGGSLDAERELKVSEQTVPAGTHTLQINLVLRGKGYKVFSYLRSYQFKVTSSYSFKVEEGRISVIRVIAETRGGLRNFVERPTIRYDERTESYREE